VHCQLEKPSSSLKETAEAGRFYKSNDEVCRQTKGWRKSPQYRRGYARNPDTKQAVNEVIADLVATGDFVEGESIVPIAGDDVRGSE
jgi:hypothetical protein